MKLTNAERKHYSDEQRTSKIVAYCYEKRCNGDRLTSDKLHALCMLTWLPSFRAVELPALWMLWDKKSALPKAKNVSELKEYGFESAIIRLASKPTGFVNYYRAYRNSSRKWIRTNFKAVSSLIRAAASLSNDIDPDELQKTWKSFQRSANRLQKQEWDCHRVS